MKKKIGRFLSLVSMAMLTLALLITSAPTMSVQAAATTYTITINGSEANHTYEAYQIFSGTVGTATDSSDTTMVTSPVWTENFKDAETRTAQVKAFIAELKSTDAFKTDGTSWFQSVSNECTAKSAQEFVKAISDTTNFPANNSENSEKLTKIIAKYFASSTNIKTKYSSGTETGSNGAYTYKIENVPGGYYLIKDKDKSISGNVSYTSYILKVAGNVTTEPKVGKPTLTKQVNTTLNGTYGKGVSADTEETVYYKLTATLPSNLRSYNEYKLVFKDVLPAGITFDKVEAAYIEDLSGNKLQDLTTSQYVVDKTTMADANAVLIKVSDLKTIRSSIATTDKVIVKYSAKLNGSATIGSSNPNKNTATLYYTNNPDVSGTGDKYPYEPKDPTDPNSPNDDEKNPDGGGSTPEDSAYVFTYQLDTTKVDLSSTSTKLQGAEFIVYKTRTVDGNAVTYYAKTLNTTTGIVSEWTTTKADAATFTSDANGLFSVKGLSAGTYYLEETTPPTGYHQLTAPIAFTIAAQITTNESNVATVSTLTITENETTTNGTASTGVVTMTVGNSKGTALPSTGGIGTTIFYVAGGILVAGAAILLIVRKRMSMEE
jgi:fimbrial isopeptide formation D2 family protein/LPXTG-motif cell wall-anchored protein